MSHFTKLLGKSVSHSLHPFFLGLVPIVDAIQFRNERVRWVARQLIWAYGQVGTPNLMHRQSHHVVLLAGSRISSHIGNRCERLPIDRKARGISGLFIRFPSPRQKHIERWSTGSALVWIPAWRDSAKQCLAFADYWKPRLVRVVNYRHITSVQNRMPARLHSTQDQRPRSVPSHGTPCIRRADHR